jgi:hypothetical protein
MDSEEMKKLFLETLRFRNAIENCDKTLLPDSFACFPKGSACDAAFILSQFLKEEGFGNFNYVSGHRKGITHTWLCNDEVQVDITADQFDDNNRKVIVMKNSDWHVTFSSQTQNTNVNSIFDEAAKENLLKVYREIVNSIATPA